MALFRITVKQKVRTNGIVLDPGMQVEVVTQSYSDPVHTNGGQVVADAFMRIYGVDVKKAGALNGKRGMMDPHLNMFGALVTNYAVPGLLLMVKKSV